MFCTICMYKSKPNCQNQTTNWSSFKLSIKHVCCSWHMWFVCWIKCSRLRCLRFLENILKICVDEKTERNRYRINISFNIVLYNTEIYLDSYPAAKTILDLPSGSSNMVFAAGYSSKYISVLHRTMLNNL